MKLQHRQLDIERFQARMPDGRLLLIERTRDLGFAPRLQSLISLLTVPLAAPLALFGGLFIPVIRSAGFGSFILFVFAAVTLVPIVGHALIRWMQNNAADQETCDVIGMDCSTDELLDLYRGNALSTPNQGRIH